MEALVAYIDYFVVSTALLGLVLVAVRLLPFISTVATTLALLQWVLPNMALIENEGPKNTLVWVIMGTAMIFGAVLDICSIRKRASHFWDIPRKPYTKD